MEYGRYINKIVNIDYQRKKEEKKNRKEKHHGQTTIIEK